MTDLPRSGFDSVFIDTEGTPIVGLSAIVLNEDNEQVTVYEAKTGLAPRTQPMTTTSAAPGLLTFWAEPGFYQIQISDNQNPPRFSSRKIPFDAVAGDTTSGNEGIVASQIRLTSAVTTNMLQNDSVTADKLRDDASTDSNRAVTRNHIRNESVTASKTKIRTYTASGFTTCTISSIPAGKYLGAYASGSSSKDGPSVISGTATLTNPLGPSGSGAFILDVTSTASVRFTIQGTEKCALILYGIAD